MYIHLSLSLSHTHTNTLTHKHARTPTHTSTHTRATAHPLHPQLTYTRTHMRVCGAHAHGLYSVAKMQRMQRMPESCASLSAQEPLIMRLFCAK